MTALLRALRPTYRLHSVYERLLGTELEVQVIAATRPQAEVAERAALHELQRLTLILNRFDPGSELRRWLSFPGERLPLSADLEQVLRLADQWRQWSGGAFHPGADALGALWLEAASTGQPPEATRLTAQVRALEASPWTLHGDGTATLHARYPLGLNALAKGYIVDRMAEEAAREAGVKAVLINAGGDLRSLGGRGVTIAVADPLTARDNAPPVARVRVRNGALASSGRAHRGYQVGRRWYSHVLDPRTGQPVQDVPGVTVTSPTCAQADALATTLSVLGVREGLALVEAHPEVTALIVAADGQKHASRGWPPL